MGTLDETNKHLIITALILLIINILIAALGSTTTTDLFTVFTKFSPTNLKDYVLSFGASAPVVFILLHLLQTIIAPIPGMLLLIAGGLIWGTFWGGLLSIIGAFIGSLLCFLLSRYLGRPFVEKLAKKEDLEFTDEFFRKHGFLAIVILRLIPFMAFDVISYGAGLTKMDFRKYATATLIGMIPTTLLYSYIGFTAGDNWLIAMALTILVLVVFFFMGTIKRLLLK